MTEWKARRFWITATDRPASDGWEVVLDDKVIRTPGKLPLILPTRALAQAIAGEWDAQEDIINPNAMPLTRAANSAVEKVAPQFGAVARMLGDYGGTDLLCYRATEPDALIRWQARDWDPLVDWSATHLHAPMRTTQGVLPVDQDPASLRNLRDRIAALDPFALTALHDLVTLSGSLILGLAVLEGRLGADEAFALSRLDEEFQASRWGRDAQADAAAENRRRAVLAAERFWKLSRRG